MSHPYLRRITAADQTATHLRDGIRDGRWKHHLPGTRKLAEELKISRFTVNEAVAKLLDEGVLVKAGGRKPHRIVAATGSVVPKKRVIRTALLLPYVLEKLAPGHQLEVVSMMSEVKSIGHECVVVALPPGKDSRKTGRLARLVRDTGADAWLVFDGTLEVLRWFIASERPTLALGGVSLNLPIAMIAGFNMAEVGREVFRRLTGMGHRRMVFICSRERRLPEPRPIIRVLYEELQAVGIKPGEYNAPDWEETPAGLEVLLKSLFRFTPPTVLICENPQVASGIFGFLAKSGISVPDDVSVVMLSLIENPVEWFLPDVRLAQLVCVIPFYRRLLEWVGNVARGRIDKRQVIYSAHLNEGNTIGPAKASAPL